MKGPTRRRGQKRLAIAVAAFFALIIVGLKLEWDAITSKSAANQMHSGGDSEPDAPTTPPSKTDCGYDLTNAGSASFWSSVRITCKGQKKYTMKDIQEHSTKGSLYLLIRGYVLDVTDFVSKHPGGDQILDGAKIEAADAFELHHQPAVGNLLSNFCVGRLCPGDAADDLGDTQQHHDSSEEAKGGAPPLKPRVNVDAGGGDVPQVPLKGSSTFWAQVTLKCKETGTFTMEDVVSHDGAEENGKKKPLYLTMRGFVFDVTSFRARHPGGEEILRGAREDSSETFEGIHSPTIAGLLNNFCIGRLVPSSGGGAVEGHGEKKAAEDDGKAVAAAGKTQWGYTLSGTPEYWAMASFTCKGDEKFTMSDIVENNGTPGKSLYLLMRGYVLDVTKFREAHPGGEAIIQGAAKDASEMFEGYHPSSTASLFGNFCKGKLYP